MADQEGQFNFKTWNPDSIEVTELKHSRWLPGTKDGLLLAHVSFVGLTQAHTHTHTHTLTHRPTHDTHMWHLVHTRVGDSWLGAPNSQLAGFLCFCLQIISNSRVKTISFLHQLLNTKLAILFTDCLSLEQIYSTGCTVCLIYEQPKEHIGINYDWQSEYSKLKG